MSDNKNEQQKNLRVKFCLLSIYNKILNCIQNDSDKL